jgi:four helix bundle protein
MSGNGKGLESLMVWQKTVDYAVDVCLKVLPHFPKEEKWALCSQIRRSVQSMPANIAEGYGRYHFKETIHFCYVARGSMAETKTFLILANRLGYIEESLKENYVNRLSELGKMLNGYITHLRKQKSVRSAQEIPDKEQAYSE